MKIEYQNNVYCQAIKEIAKIIKGTRWEGHVFLVGGAVRDLLMKRPIKDIDLCVDMVDGGIDFAEWICKETDCYKNGSNPVVFTRFQTAKFNIRSIKDIAEVDIETVCTRKETYTEANGRKPEVKYGTINEDCLRRDLTINALYVNISTDEVLDPSGKGIEDLHNCIIRTPTDPNKTYLDDPLRMLRCIRFAARFGWGIERDTWIGIVTNAHRINTISQERITDEINKILISNRPSYGIRQLNRCGLLKKVLPEVHKLIGCTQGHQHFGDVFEHTMAALEKTKPIMEHRMAALLHDIAKPECKSTVNGVIHFFSHEYRGATIATEILKRMKYSNLETKSIVTAIKNHMRFKQSGNHCPSNKAIRKFVSEIGSDQIDIVLDVINADNNSHDEQFNYPDQTDLIRLKIAELSEKEKMTDKIVLPINGNDIMEHFNMKKGPKIGEYLDLVKEKYLDNPSISKEECFEIIKGKLVY